jgi:hypothetical protein
MVKEKQGFGFSLNLCKDDKNDLPQYTCVMTAYFEAGVTLLILLSWHSRGWCRWQQPSPRTIITNIGSTATTRIRRWSINLKTLPKSESSYGHIIDTAKKRSRFLYTRRKPLDSFVIAFFNNRHIMTLAPAAAFFDTQNYLTCFPGFQLRLPSKHWTLHSQSISNVTGNIIFVRD